MWKKLCVFGMSLALAGTLLAGCNDSKEPAKPVDPPTASFKMGASQAKLYEMKSDITLPKLQLSRRNAAAVTEDSIYVFAAPERQNENLLKRIKFKDNKLLSIADVGKSRDPYVFGNKKYAWFRTKDGKDDMLNVFDGEKLTTKKYNSGYMTPYGRVLSDQVYVECGSDLIEGTIEKGEFKEGKTLLKKWWRALEARNEVPEGLSGVDSKGFYLRARLKADQKQGIEATTRLYEYSKEGKAVRGFDANAAKDQGAQVYRHNSNECVAVTEDYVVFTSYDSIRAFKKKDGNYVGEFVLRVNDQSLSVSIAIPMGKNDILLLCSEQPSTLYRLSL